MQEVLVKRGLSSMFFSSQRYVFLCFFLISSASHAAAPAPAPAGTNQTVNNNPHISANNPIFQPQFSPTFITNTTSTIHAIGVKIGDIAVMMSQTIKEIVTKENITTLRDMIKQLLWHHRYKIAGGAILGTYSAASILLISDYHNLNNNMFWAHWKHKLTFEDLCAISQKELAKELLLAVGQHHYNKENLTDLAYPLIAFIKEIDWEIDTIKRYIRTAKMIKSIALMPFFPTNDKKLNVATRMLERVLFIKHIFLSWLADYNLTSTEKLNG